MNWQQIENAGRPPLVVHFTNDQPSTDFSISKQFEDCFRLAIHTKDSKTGEFLKVIFRTLEDAKAHAEAMSETENSVSTGRIVDALADYLSLARLLVQREEGARLGQG